MNTEQTSKNIFTYDCRFFYYFFRILNGIAYIETEIQNTVPHLIRSCCFLFSRTLQVSFWNMETNYRKFPAGTQYSGNIREVFPQLCNAFLNFIINSMVLYWNRFTFRVMLWIGSHQSLTAGKKFKIAQHYYNHYKSFPSGI